MSKNRNVFFYLTLFYIFCIFIFTYIGRGLSNYLVDRDLLVTTLVVSFVFFGLLTALYLRMRFKSVDLYAFLMLCLIGIVAVLMIINIKYPVEKIHFIEYGVLAVILRKGFFSRFNLIWQYGLTLFLAGGIGLADECFQYYLPLRFFDWRDVGINFFSSVLALSGYEVIHNQSSFFRLRNFNR